MEFTEIIKDEDRKYMPETIRVLGIVDERHKSVRVRTHALNDYLTEIMDEQFRDGTKSIPNIK